MRFLQYALGALATMLAIKESLAQSEQTAVNMDKPIEPTPLAFSTHARRLSGESASCAPGNHYAPCEQIVIAQEALQALKDIDSEMSFAQSLNVNGHILTSVSAVKQEIHTDADQEPDPARRLRVQEHATAEHTYKIIRLDLPGVESEQAYIVLEDGNKVYASVRGADGSVILIQPCAEQNDVTCHTQTTIGKNEQQKAAKIDDPDDTVAPTAVQFAAAKQNATSEANTTSGGRELAQQQKMFFRFTIAYTNTAADDVSVNRLNGQSMLFVESLNQAVRDSGFGHVMEFEFHKATSVHYSATDSYHALLHTRTIDAQGADIVALMYSGRENSQQCGRAFLDCGAQARTPEQLKQCMRLVVSLACALSRYTFAHEAAHLFGADHQASVSNPGRFSDNHGYLHTVPQDSPMRDYYWFIGTIMAYHGDIRVPYFSMPGRVLEDGTVTGGPGADNSRVMPIVAREINQIRGGGGSVPTTTPSPIGSATPRPSQVTTNAPAAKTTSSPTGFPTKQPTTTPTAAISSTIGDNTYLPFQFRPKAEDGRLTIMLNDNLQVLIGHQSLIVRRKQGNNWVRLSGTVIEHAEKITMDPDNLKPLNFRINKIGNDVSIQLVEIASQRINRRVVKKEVPISLTSFKVPSADLNVKFPGTTVITQPIKRIITPKPTHAPTKFPTKAPVAAKTSRPTVKPTTSFPTSAATKAPTGKNSTPYPTTDAPTNKPTGYPTKRRG